MNFKELTEANGGLTMQLGTGKLNPESTGYYVGGVVPSVIINRSSNELGYLFAVTELRESVPMTATHLYLGTWIDTQPGGAVHLDISEHYTDLETALRVASDRGELAIWDIANGAEIRLTDVVWFRP